MPRFDGTGPNGAGPGTGWGLGPCGGGRAWGLGRGFNNCFAHRNYLTKQEEAKMIQEEVTAMEEDLKALKERLKEIGS